MELLLSNYDARSITVLEGLEAVRKRPGMYIGSTGERGLHHLVYEVVDNSVDEALAGYATDIQVTLLADGGVRVNDDGRGIPVDEHPVEHRPAVEVVLTTLHAGGKFDGESYAVSGGLHGVGVSVVNALAVRLDVEVRRDGYVWSQTYAARRPGGDLCTAASRRTRPGTTTTFWPDADDLRDHRVVLRDAVPAAAGDGVPQPGPADLADRRAAAKVVSEDDEDDRPGRLQVGWCGKARTVVYEYPGGIADFVRYLNASKEPVHARSSSSATSRRACRLEIAMQWNASYTESVHTFANVINTAEGGTHEEGSAPR